MASPQYAFSMGKLEIVQSTRGMHSNLFISYNKIDILTKVIKRMILLLYIYAHKRLNEDVIYEVLQLQEDASKAIDSNGWIN